jgi:biopolymer transport protein TolQ
MLAPLLLQINPPDLAAFQTWASGPGFPATAACGLLLLLAFTSLIRIFSRRRSMVDFDEADVAFLNSFRNSAHVLAVFQDSVEFKGSPHWQVYRAGCRELAFHLIGIDHVEPNFATRLSAAGRISSSQMETVRRAMQRAADEIESDFQLVTNPDSKDESFIRWIGLILGMAIFAESALNLSGTHHDVAPLLFLPALLPLGLSILLSLMVSASAASLVRRNATAAARLQLFPAELSIMIERTFVDHGAHPAELPSVASLGAPAAPSFNLPPSDSFTRLGP